MADSITYLRSIFRQGRFIFVGTVLDRLMFFVVFLVIARTSAPAVYGVVVASFAFCNLIHTFFDLGLSFYFQRESSDPRKNLADQLSTAFWYKALTFIPYVTAAIIYFVLSQSTHVVSLVLIATIVFGFGIAGILNSILYGKSAYKDSLVIQFNSRFLFLAIIPVMGYLHASVEAVLCVLLFSVVLQSFLLVKYFRANFVSNIRGFNSETLWRILHQSAPMGIGLLLVTIYDRVDVLLIQNMVGLEAVASYAVAYSLYKLPLIASGVVLIPAYTKLSNEFAEHGAIAGSNIRRIGALQLGICIVIAAVIWISPATWLSIVYGTRYSGSATVLSLVTLALPALFLNNFTGVVLNSMHKERSPLVSTAVGAVVNVAVNIVMIPQYGIMGAAIATVAAEYVVLLAECVYIWLNRHLITQWSKAGPELGL